MTKLFGFISVVYFLSVTGARQGYLCRSRVQSSREDADRCIRDWKSSFTPFLRAPEAYEFTVEELYTKDLTKVVPALAGLDMTYPADLKRLASETADGLGLPDNQHSVLSLDIFHQLEDVANAAWDQARATATPVPTVVTDEMVQSGLDACHLNYFTRVGSTYHRCSVDSDDVRRILKAALRLNTKG